MTTVAVSPDASTVAVGEAQFTNNVYIPSRTAIQFRDAATGAVTGGFVGGENGASGFPAPYFLGFDADGTSIFSGTEVVYCGSGGSGNCSLSQSLIRLTLTGQNTFYASDLSDFEGMATSGPYLTYLREFGPYGSEFAVFDTSQDGVPVVFTESRQIGTSGISGATAIDVTFSPDGTRLATTRHVAGDEFVDLRTVGMWTIDQSFGPLGDGQRPLVPAISPDNSVVALGTYPIAGGIPSGLYVFRADGASAVFSPWAADGPSEVRYGARLAFTSDNAHIVGVEAGYVGGGTARWVSVFRASDGIRLATRRIGTSSTSPNGSGGALAIVPISSAPGVDRFAVAARDYAGVVEVETAPRPVAAEGTPSSSLTLTVAPNPAVAGTTLRVASAEGQTLRVELFDALGRRVAILFDRPVAGGTEWSIPLGALTAGVYVVRATGASGTASQRVVVTPR